MSKTSVTLGMLRLLATQQTIKVSDFAELLETNPRNILEYKKELETAGFVIDSIPGRYGGYRLSTKALMPTLRIKSNEKKALDEGLNYLKNRNDFLFIDDYLKAMGSIYSSLETDTIYDEMTIINRFPLVMSEQKIKDRYMFLDLAIKDQYVIKITYQSQNHKEKTHHIHPYKLYMYNNAWFIIAWNESVHDVGFFKLNRILTYETTKMTFEISQTFQVNQYLDKFGMKSNDEEYRLKLKITPPYQFLVTERIYGKDQSLEFIDDQTTILNVTMRHLNQIKAFILGFGGSCEVIEPIELRNQIKEDLMKTLNVYQIKDEGE